MPVLSSSTARVGSTRTRPIPPCPYSRTGPFTRRPSRCAAPRLPLCPFSRDRIPQGANASFTFNGTGVYVYGAKRSTHGAYAVSVDGNVTHGNGTSAVSEFQQLLFADAGLPYGEHHVVLTNDYTDTTHPTFFDIDSVVITMGDGDAKCAAFYHSMAIRLTCESQNHRAGLRLRRRFVQLHVHRHMG
jgi:hypothetical protein